MEGVFCPACDAVERIGKGPTHVAIKRGEKRNTRTSATSIEIMSFLGRRGGEDESADIRVSPADRSGILFLSGSWCVCGSGSCLMGALQFHLAEGISLFTSPNGH